ncbi:hypothetical protein MASR1M36_15050 [Candidatus Cloacimonadaceae bacterium]
MINVWCVRADFGKYTEQFVNGGYAAVGWIGNKDLSNISNRDEVNTLYRDAYPEDVSNIVIGQQVGQISRFLLEIKAGDYIITPSANTDRLHYGVVAKDPSYFYSGIDACPFRHRRKVKWIADTVLRSTLSVPFQNTMKSSLTVFSISHKDEFLSIIGKGSEVAIKATYDSYKVVLDRILELDPKEFEILVGHLLTALGFEGTTVTGKVGDGGVDVMGELDVSNLAKIKLFVQVKRFKTDVKISASDVKQLRAAIPKDGQGAFITTADYQKKANVIALDPDFPRIGLINGKQLVDLLIEHWNDIPNDFQDRLGLEPGLVLK